VLCGAAAAGAPPGPPAITLDQALARARAANARLPVPALEVQIARERIREARSERWLQLAVEGDFVYAPEPGYDPILTNLGEERLQAVARQPLLDGGARRAAVVAAQAGHAAARARYRMAELDVDLDVRSRFAEVLAFESEIRARQDGLARLRSYRAWLEGRHGSGQAVAADLLKTRVREAAEEADLIDAERRAEEARLALNDLMGQDPAQPLTLAQEGPPEPPAAEPGDPWTSAPEILEAQARALALQANVTIARSGKRPHLFAEADVGLWGSDTTQVIPPDLRASHPGATLGDRFARDAGYSVSLNLSWPVWGSGALRARIAESEFALGQARKEVTARRRQARLDWEQARDAREKAYRRTQILSAAVPVARDSYLEAESRYRGGAGTALEVLDAFASSVDTQVRLAQATMQCRIARALAIRWEGDATP
jgi:outer membrane protein TolC